MLKLTLLLFALVAVAVAKPYGGAVVSQNHVSSSVVSPHLGIGYGLGGIYPGMGGLGHSISSHSISHAAVPHYGYGMMGIKGLGYGIGAYPGLGYAGYGGYGLMG